MEIAIAVYVYACAYLGSYLYKRVTLWKDFTSFWPALGVLLLCLIVAELLILWVALIPLVIVVLLIILKVIAMIDDRRRARGRA